MKPENLRKHLAAPATLAVGLAVAACGSEDTSPEDEVVLGALLPYTGPSAGLGSNIEKSLLSLEKTIERSGGLVGKGVSISLHDSHSDLTRGAAAVRELLDHDRVLGLLGPEEPDLAVEIASLVRDARVVEMLPGHAAPNLADDGDDLWFRTGPAAPAVAGAMVQEMRAADIQRLLILFEPDAYGTELNRLLACQFQAEGGIWAKSTPLVGEISSIVSGFAFAAHDAIALIARPEVGAQVVVEQSVAGARVARWYLSPTLASEEFVRNVLPGSLEKAVGIAPALDTFKNDFDEAYAERWGGAPLTPTYYYHDSAAIWALAVEAASEDGQLPSSDEVAAQLRLVSSPPGEKIEWDELGRGLELVRDGVDINYEGVAGHLDIGDDGQASQNILRFWQVSEGEIEFGDGSDYSQSLAEQCR